MGARCWGCGEKLGRCFEPCGQCAGGECEHKFHHCSASDDDA